MLNPLKIASDGYLNRTTKAVLIIAVAGYLNFQGTPPVPPSPPDAGGGGSSYVGKRSKYSYEEQQEDERRERERKDELFLIEFLKTATEIINNQ